MIKKWENRAKQLVDSSRSIVESNRETVGSIQEIFESSQDNEAFTQYKNYDVGLDQEIEL